MGGAVRANRKKSCRRLRSAGREEMLRLYPTRPSRCAIESASAMRFERAELLGTEVKTECLDRKRGHYAIAARMFYRITAQAVLKSGLKVKTIGLAILRRRMILAGKHEKDACRAAVVDPDLPAVFFAMFSEGIAPDQGEGVKGIPPCLLDCFGNDLNFGREGRSAWFIMKQSFRVRLQFKLRGVKQ
jgi:hypothetical protein